MQLINTSFISTGNTSSEFDNFIDDTNQDQSSSCNNDTSIDLTDDQEIEELLSSDESNGTETHTTRTRTTRAKKKTAPQRKRAANNSNGEIF